jgi:spermidine synthase
VRATWKVAGLLFCSGACALIYQTVWIRQFRLIFGASTAATAAVLAIFMAGLGIGSARLGKRADAQPNPLRYYGNLELLIAAASALSQPLLWIVAKLYFATGGSVTLGIFGASIVRLLLASAVLGAATVLMGGTLPAAARAVEESDDEGRRRLSLLYGVNTLGAVFGTVISTFFMLEILGNRRTLLIAVLVNALVGIAARGMSSKAEPRVTAMTPVRGTSKRILAAAAIVGFAFLVMELVWYRMLAPLLGGTTFTFGLILAIALLGIGAGGAAYAFWRGNRQATVAGFALTCALEALAISIPFALGDRLAVLELHLRPVGTLGFGGSIIAWTIVSMIVVFPAAFISGIQFPLLISLLGRGETDVGSDVGAAYAWNTAGAIAGSLAAGFGLPYVTAPGAWRLMIVVLALLSVAAIRRPVPTAIAALAVAGVFALGPTAVWRHSGIGAGRAATHEKANDRRDWINRERRGVVWDVDGRESSVALIDTSDIAFIVNGKSDGSARGDAGTQVMAGLVPAILHPMPRRALVVGLGTGSTAGWLGAIPEMEHVDAVELEPAVIGVARACSAVNHDVLHNPKVRIRIADAREVLLATPERYDIIFSEPSNPYRAGIASLFTEEFYRASASRLRAGGLFAQWLQTYSVDSQTIRTIYATIGAVFPHVETWTTDSGDLLLVGSREPVRYDFDRLRSRVASEPFRSALAYAWRVESLEGFIARFLGRDTLARAIAASEPETNTDDRTVIEFGFARGLGGGSFSMDTLSGLARARAEDRPIGSGAIDWRVVAANRAGLSWVNALIPNASADDLARRRIALSNSNIGQVAIEWRGHPFAPINSGELALIAEALADVADERAEALAEALRRFRPIDADAVFARLRFRQARLDESVALMQRVFIACRRDPWPTADLIGRLLDLASNVAHTRAYSARLHDALEQPFAAGQWEDIRKYYRFTMAHDAEGCGPRTIRALQQMEPWPVWNESTLRIRRDCYQSVNSPLAARAQRDFESYADAEPLPFAAGVTAAPSGSSSDPR